MMNSLLTLKEQRRVVNIELVVPDSTARRRHGRDTIPVPIFTITIRALVFFGPTQVCLSQAAYRSVHPFLQK